MTSKPKNCLLAAIPDESWPKVREALELVRFEQGRVLLEAGQRFTHVYFPEEGVISTVAMFANGGVAEAAATGPEGVVSVGAVLGGTHAFNRKIVQVPGSIFRVDVDSFARLQIEFPAFGQKLLDYVLAFLAQVQQSVVCNGTHSIEERCARWLLTCHDRCANDHFPLTQEFLAEMLGASRPAVNHAARALQGAGLISYSRGIIEIDDRAGLEKVSCECYATVRAHFDRLMPGCFLKHS